MYFTERMQQAQVVDDLNEQPEQAAAGDQLSTASDCHVPPFTPESSKVMTGTILLTADARAFVSL